MRNWADVLESPLESHFRNRSTEWTLERIAKLGRAEIEQLKKNALGLGEDGVAALCDAALAAYVDRPSAAPARKRRTRRGTFPI
jgi:hypothetical protein